MWRLSDISACQNQLVARLSDCRRGPVQQRWEPYERAIKSQITIVGVFYWRKQNRFCLVQKYILSKFRFTLTSFETTQTSAVTFVVRFTAWFRNNILTKFHLFIDIYTTLAASKQAIWQRHRGDTFERPVRTTSNSVIILIATMAAIAMKCCLIFFLLVNYSKGS